MLVPECELPPEELPRKSDGTYDLEKKPWESAPTADKVWTGGSTAHFIPVEHDWLRLDKSQIETNKCYVDYSSGWVTYVDESGKERWTEGFAGTFQPRMYRIKFQDALKPHIRVGAVYWEKADDNPHKWVYKIGARRTQSGHLTFFDAEDWNGLLGKGSKRLSDGPLP